MRDVRVAGGHVAVASQAGQAARVLSRPEGARGEGPGHTGHVGGSVRIS